jgi:hypothetical protein
VPELFVAALEPSVADVEQGGSVIRESVGLVVGFG